MLLKDSFFEQIFPSKFLKRTKIWFYHIHILYLKPVFQRSMKQLVEKQNGGNQFTKVREKKKHIQYNKYVNMANHSKQALLKRSCLVKNKRRKKDKV